MATALFVSGTDSARTDELLKKTGVDKVVCVHSCGEARRRLSATDYDLVIINAPLSDENGLDLALTAADASTAGILLLVKSDLVDVVQSHVESAGVGVLGKPVPSEEILRFARLLLAMHRRYTDMRREVDALKTKMEEIRVVDRAKLVLIESLHMTENQAHKYIERQAMDMRITRKTVAERILKTYE